MESSALKNSPLFSTAGSISASRGKSITTEILVAPTFYYAEDYRQQYLANKPNGYCRLGGTGLEIPH